MPPRTNKSIVSNRKDKNKVSLISLLNNFLDTNLSQAEITQNAFAIQLQLAKCLSSRQVPKSRNLLKKSNINKEQADDETDSDDDDESFHTKKRKKNKELFDQDKFAEKAISIVAHFLNPNQHNGTEEIAQNILTIMNFIPSLLQKIDSNDQVYIQNLLAQIEPNSPALFELQLPLLHSISEILHGPQLSSLFQTKIKSFITPNSNISSSLLNICIFNFEYQKNYQLQWAEIIRSIFLSSNRQELLNSSLLLKSKRTCSVDLCNMLCRILQHPKQNQNERLDKLDFFLILILSSISSIATSRLLKLYANNNRLNELTIKNCPLHVIPMNNIIDAVYTISSSRNLNSKNDQAKELSRIISEIFICSENPEILTFALFNEDENKILLESTIEAISISSLEAPQLFISQFDSIGVLYTVSKQIARRLIKPILKLSSIFTQLFDSIVIYLKKLSNHPSGLYTSIDSLCSLLQDLAQQQNQAQTQVIKKKSRYQRNKKNQEKLLNEENQSSSIEMQLQIVKVLESIASSSQYTRYLTFRKLSEVVPYLSDSVRNKVKQIANKYKESTLNSELFLNLVTDKLSEESNETEDIFNNSTNFVFAREYPASELQLLISLGDRPSDFFYFVELQKEGFAIDFHFSLQLALRADVYAVLSPFNNDAFLAFSEYLKAIDFIASEEERRIISEWCSLKLDPSFVREMIVEERYDDPLLLYTLLRQLTLFSSDQQNDNELILACRKLFVKTAQSENGFDKINLQNHHLRCKFLPKEAFEDVYEQFREELTFQIAQHAEKKILNSDFDFNFDFGFFVDEMKSVIMENAITSRHCQSFLDIFEKSLPVSSESAAKMFDLLATLKFDDFKLFSAILDLTFSKSPVDDAFNAANLLLACVRGEEKVVFVKKESLKNVVFVQISRFLTNVAETRHDCYGQMMMLLDNLMSFENLNQSICFSFFKCINVFIKLFSTELNKMTKSANNDDDDEQQQFFTFDEFMKFKENCENWISLNKQKVGIKRCGTSIAYLQMTENFFKRINKKKEGFNNDDDEEEDIEDDLNGGTRMHDYGAEFDSLLEMLQNEENNKDKDDNNSNGDDEEINFEELLMKTGSNDHNSRKKKKKMKKMKKLPQFVPRKWRSKSKWIDEGLKEVTDSDDNFADLEDFVVESSPPQSDYNNEDDEEEQSD